VKKTKSRHKYPKALKRKIAQEYLAGKFSYAVAAEEYGLPGKDVVKEFVRWYRRNHDIETMSDHDPPLHVNPEPEDTSSKGQSADIDQLQQELAAARLKIAGLEALIDTAEKEFNIDIRKKSGTKRS
jgi:transposase-like protein